MNTVILAITRAAQICACGCAFRLAGVISPPSDGGVVVMCSGIDHAVRIVAMRKIHMRPGIGKSKLQNFHSRNVQALAQRVHLGSNVPEVFGDERQLAQMLPQGMEKIVTRSWHPAAMLSGGVAGGNLPILLESAKVVEPQDVAGF